MWFSSVPQCEFNEGEKIIVRCVFAVGEVVHVIFLCPTSLFYF